MEILAKCTSTEPLYMQLSRAASVKDSACLDTITELGPTALDDCGPVCLPGAIMNCENLQKIHKAKSGVSHRKPCQVFKSNVRFPKQPKPRNPRLNSGEPAGRQDAASTRALIEGPSSWPPSTLEQCTACAAMDFLRCGEPGLDSEMGSMV